MISGLLLDKRKATDKNRIVSHILFWTALYCISFYFIKSSYSIYRDSVLAYLIPVRHILGLIIVFYPLMYVLIPRFLIEKRWELFLGYSSILVLLYLFIEAFGEQLTFKFCESCKNITEVKNPAHLSVLRKSLIENILYKASNIGLFVNLFSGLILPIAIKSSVGYYRVYIKNLGLEKEKVQLELNFLKAQVNPHFLFNTLNNLYSLIIHGRSDESAETVTKLSSFMRYSLENANKMRIPLSEEITLLNDYVKLESLRLNYTRVDFKFNAKNSNLLIPPLLFIPLIENAFKYNTDNKNSVINIKLYLKNNILKFEIENTFDKKQRKIEGGGYGLYNLEKRLDLYYSNTYVYTIDNRNSLYKAYLKIKVE